MAAKDYSTQMHELLEIGIIGAGGVTRSIHLPGFGLCPGVSIHAVCDADLAAAAKSCLDLRPGQRKSLRSL